MSTSGAGSDYKSQVLQSVNIVDLIGHSVALKRRGRDFVGLCPFHQEKTPSFHVKPEKQYFVCFGCKAAGNAIDFVMRRDRIEFIDALRVLGEQAGIEMPRSGATRQKSGEKQALLEMQSAACAFFEKLLADPARGKMAREYLDQRGINADSVKRFQIGLAADAWDALLSGPVGRKYPPPQLALGGLAKARDGGSGYYDTFRNRLMFPIRDENGRVIAFGGRVMPGSQDPAKYLNSPETPLFSKSRCIFGLDLARQRIVETRTAVVVEGYTDVVMSHQFGAANVVSVLGTAMTEQHVGILRRFADKIVLLFDADAAGDTAVDRSVALFLTQPVEILIASMPEGIDPDEYLLEHGAERFANEVIGGAVDALSYKWKQLQRRFVEHGDDLTGRQKALEQYLEMLASSRGSGPVDPIRWGLAVTQVSKLTEIPVEELNRRFNVRSKPSTKRPAAAPSEIAAEGAGPAGGTAGPPGRIEPAERQLLGVLLLDPHRWEVVQNELGPSDFGDQATRRLAEVYWSHQRDEGEPVFNEFLGQLQEPLLVELAVASVEEVEALGDVEATLRGAMHRLREVRTIREERKLRAELRRTSEEQDADILLKKLQEHARRPDLRRV